MTTRIIDIETGTITLADEYSQPPAPRSGFTVLQISAPDGRVVMSIERLLQEPTSTPEVMVTPELQEA